MPREYLSKKKKKNALQNTIPEAYIPIRSFAEQTMGGMRDRDLNIQKHNKSIRSYGLQRALNQIHKSSPNASVKSIPQNFLESAHSFFLACKIFNAVSAFVHILKRIHVVVLLKKPLFCSKACHSRDTCMENTKNTHLHQLAVGKDNAATQYLSCYLSRSYLEVSAYTAFLSSPVEGCA